MSNFGFIRKKTNLSQFCCAEGAMIGWITPGTVLHKLGQRPWKHGWRTEAPKEVEKLCKQLGGCDSSIRDDGNFFKAFNGACDDVQGNYMRGCSLKSFDFTAHRRYDKQHMKGGYWPKSWLPTLQKIVHLGRKKEYMKIWGLVASIMPYLIWKTTGTIPAALGCLCTSLVAPIADYNRGFEVSSGYCAGVDDCNEDQGPGPADFFDGMSKANADAYKRSTGEDYYTSPYNNWLSKQKADTNVYSKDGYSKKKHTFVFPGAGVKKLPKKARASGPMRILLRTFRQRQTDPGFSSDKLRKSYSPEEVAWLSKYDFDIGRSTECVFSAVAKMTMCKCTPGNEAMANMPVSAREMNRQMPPTCACGSAASRDVQVTIEQDHGDCKALLPFMDAALRVTFNFGGSVKTIETFKSKMRAVANSRELRWVYTKYNQWKRRPITPSFFEMKQNALHHNARYMLQDKGAGLKGVKWSTDTNPKIVWARNGGNPVPNYLITKDRNPILDERPYLKYYASTPTLLKKGSTDDVPKVHKCSRLPGCNYDRDDPNRKGFIPLSYVCETSSYDKPGTFPKYFVGGNVSGQQICNFRDRFGATSAPYGHPCSCAATPDCPMDVHHCRAENPLWPNDFEHAIKIPWWFLDMNSIHYKVPVDICLEPLKESSSDTAEFPH